MIREFLELPPFVFITLIVQTQLIITGIMSGVITLLLIRRTHHRRWAERRHQFFAEHLVGEMLDLLEAAPVARRIKRPRWPADRRVLKAALIEHLRSVSGPEREYLVKRYDELGFVRSDLHQLKSWFWWRRLAAASDLNLLEARRFAGAFNDLSRDRNELVSAFGFFALSGLKHDLNRPFPIRSFPASVRSRRNLMTEILRNWARVRGQVVLTDQIPHVRDASSLDVLVAAAGSVPTPEVARAFAEFLSSGNAYPASLTERMLTCLTRVGDPSFVDAVRPYVRHQHDVVRLRALEYLVQAGEDRVLTNAGVRGDPSPVVRRAVTRWRSAREAA